MLSLDITARDLCRDLYQRLLPASEGYLDQHLQLVASQNSYYGVPVGDPASPGATQFRGVAVLEGMAEPEMCMPYMRRLAEQKADTIIDRDPNGFVLLNENLEIIRMNQAFKNMFSCSDSLVGRKISYLIDPKQFENLIAGKDDATREYNHYPNYNLMCHTVAYRLPEEEQIVGLFVDVTDSKSSKDKLNALRSETVERAQELIDHQIDMAQELARFLGENTARGEVLMKNLIDSINK